MKKKSENHEFFVGKVIGGHSGGPKIDIELYEEYREWIKWNSSETYETFEKKYNHQKEDEKNNTLKNGAEKIKR